MSNSSLSASHDENIVLEPPSWYWWQVQEGKISMRWSSPQELSAIVEQQALLPFSYINGIFSITKAHFFFYLDFYLTQVICFYIYIYCFTTHFPLVLHVFSSRYLFVHGLILRIHMAVPTQVQATNQALRNVSETQIQIPGRDGGRFWFYPTRFQCLFGYGWETSHNASYLLSNATGEVLGWVDWMGGQVRRWGWLSYRSNI